MAQVYNIHPLQTSGEQEILEFLVGNLPNDYTIYVQPNLNNNRPDIIILHPLKGVFIIEVKDWKLERYYKKENKFYKRDKLCGDVEIPPIDTQVKRYEYIFKNFMHDLPVYCAISFPNADSNEVKQYITNAYFAVGYDNKENLIDYIRNAKAQNLNNHIQEIQNFINPPRHAKYSGNKIKLTQQQKSIVEHKVNSWKRVRGVAGSGKTIVIANKAAQVASEGKRVLILTYNKTLVPYIKEHLEKTDVEFDWNLIEIFHFHGFGKVLLQENDIQYGIDNFILELKKLAESKENTKDRKYDAILIDEAQDFEKKWFDIALQFLSHNDEVLLVADDKQNLYDRNISWINQSMAGLGYKFKGAWGNLNKNFRSKHLPEIINQSHRFAEMFLKKILIENPEKNFGAFMIPEVHNEEGSLGFMHLYWRNMIGDNIETIFDKVRLACDYANKKNFENSDIAILVSDVDTGVKLVSYLDRLGISTTHTFGNLEKDNFSVHSNHIKVSTIHSFKGLEIKAVIVINDDKDTIKNIFETYVAITRPMDYLVVFNRSERFYEYGKTWQ